MAFQFRDEKVDEHRQDRRGPTPELTESSTEGYLRLGRRYIQLGLHQNALDSLLKALQMARVKGDQRLECTILNTLGEVYLEMRKCKAAIGCHKRVIKILEADMKTWIKGARAPEERRRRTKTAAEKAARTISRSSRPRSTAKCPNCRNAIEKDDKFCIGCGKEITPSK